MEISELNDFLQRQLEVLSSSVVKIEKNVSILTEAIANQGVIAERLRSLRAEYDQHVLWANKEKGSIEDKIRDVLNGVEAMKETASDRIWKIVIGVILLVVGGVVTLGLSKFFGGHP